MPCRDVLLYLRGPWCVPTGRPVVSPMMTKGFQSRSGAPRDNSQMRGEVERVVALRLGLRNPLTGSDWLRHDRTVQGSYRCSGKGRTGAGQMYSPTISQVFRVDMDSAVPAFAESAAGREAAAAGRHQPRFSVAGDAEPATVPGLVDGEVSMERPPATPHRVVKTQRAKSVA